MDRNNIPRIEPLRCHRRILETHSIVIANRQDCIIQRIFLSNEFHVTKKRRISCVVNIQFLHVDDMAAASIHVMELDREVWQENTEPMLSHINVGTGVDCTIRELAQTIAQVVGYKGRVVFDATKPDGTPRKLLDVSRLHQLGWYHEISLEAGLASTYQWFLENQQRFRG